MNKPPSSPWPWIMLPARSILFIAFQAMFAAGYLITSTGGFNAAWEASANWWPITVTLTNLVCIVLLVRLFQREGERYQELFHFQRQYWKTDLAVMFGMLIISGPIAFLPNILLGRLLFGDAQIPLNMFMRHLPLWAAVASILLFPLTQGLAELPTYFGYSMPRLGRQTGRPWLGLTFAALALGLQHLAMPLLFDWRFFTWRMLMYIPFAFLVGILLLWRPRLMPYMVVVHILIDLATALMLLSV